MSRLRAREWAARRRAWRAARRVWRRLQTLARAQQQVRVEECAELQVAVAAAMTATEAQRTTQQSADWAPRSAASAPRRCRCCCRLSGVTVVVHPSAAALVAPPLVALCRRLGVRHSWLLLQRAVVSQKPNPFFLLFVCLFFFAFFFFLLLVVLAPCFCLVWPVSFESLDSAARAADGDQGAARNRGREGGRELRDERKGKRRHAARWWHTNHSVRRTTDADGCAALEASDPRPHAAPVGPTSLTDAGASLNQRIKATTFVG